MAFHIFKMKFQDKFDFMQGGELMTTIAEKRNKSMLIAQIGRGTYLNTNYAVLHERISSADVHQYKIDDLAAYQTGYTFEAVLHELQYKKDTDIDTLLLIGTSTSYWGSLCSYFLRNSEAGEAETGFITEEHLIEVIERLKEEAGEEITREELKRKEIGEKAPIRIEGEGRGAGIPIDIIAENDKVKQAVEHLLTGIIQKKLSCHTQIRILILEKGIDDEEIKKNFTLLQTGLESIVAEYYETGEIGPSQTDQEDTERLVRPEIDLYLDVSNGFRSLPMYIYSFASYLTRIRRENYRIYMYYGMADAKGQYGGGKKLYAPLVDLDQITDLMHWINAINEFHNMGSVRELINIFREKEEWNIGTGDADYPDLRTVFEMFEYAANAHNLKVLEDTIGIMRSMKDLDDSLDKFPESGKLPRQAVVMLQDIGEEFEERFSGEGIRERFKYSNLTLRLAEWFYDEGRIGSSAIAAMEGVTTYLLERFSELDEMTIIQEYLIREPVKQLLMEDKNRTDFGKAYDSIRRNIRNIGAHILFQEVSGSDVIQYKKDIESVLEKMLIDIKKEKNEDSIFLSLSNEIHESVEMNIHKIRKPYKTAVKIQTEAQRAQKVIGTLKIVEILPDDLSKEVYKALCELKIQVKRMEELEKKGMNGLPVFINELDELTVLKACMSFWIGAGKEEHFEIRYHSGFGKNKNGRTASDRILNFFATHGEKFVEIAKSIHREKVFINCSNHPSETWCAEQKKAAEEYGRIVDIRFPEVDPGWTNAQVNAEAERICGEIDQYNAAAVMCQGEFTLTYAIISRLKEKGITVLAACSRRRTEEIINDDGSTQKKALYSFEGFREF